MSLPPDVVALAALVIMMVGTFMAMTAAVRVGEAHTWRQRLDGALYALAATVAFALALLVATLGA